KAYAETGAELAIICSSDTVYEDLAEDVARALKAAGAKRVFLAGRPAAEAEAKYRAAGVDAFIFLGCDARTTLRGALADLGVIDR
ncbi:MAG: methylmalonyl-CoA mutase, partial [Rhodobacterales bacterium]|nr:methylmalonyl-CoA mutase [Rhodobacterales bacterium]